MFKLTLKSELINAALILFLLQAWTKNYHASSVAAIAIDTTSTLPPRLQDAVCRGLLARPRPDIYVLGTVHVGSESAEDVQTLIETVKPSTVVIEIPPSRLKRIRQNNNDRHKNPTAKDHLKIEPPKSGMINALRSLPALAAAGWSKGGIAGMLFSTVIVGSSLLKQSTTLNEEEKTLPRRNEFTAAIEAADKAGSTVIPADFEFEELITAVTQNVSPLGWIKLGINVLSETVGLRPIDPIKRRRNETMVQWAERRRDVLISRASKVHGEKMAPDLSRALVDDRDARFTKACIKVIKTTDINNQDESEGSAIIVCVIGLVHLDGVVNRLCAK